MMLYLGAVGRRVFYITSSIILPILTPPFLNIVFATGDEVV
jgi:hypothetical protein